MNCYPSIRVLITLCFILFFSIFSHSQTIAISGTFKGFEGEQIYLCRYSDPFVFSEKKLDSTKIDGQGRFVFKTKITETQQVFFKLQNIKSYLFVEPNKKYEIKILSKDSLYVQYPRAMKTIALGEIPLTILKSDTADINLLIEKFNFLFSKFVLKNQKLLLDSRNKKLLDSLQNMANSKFLKYHNDYLNAFIRYKIASLDMAESLTHKQKFAFAYFVNKPILYENSEYMNLFNEYFKKHFDLIKSDARHDSILSEINIKKSYTGMIKILSEDTLFKTDAALRELLLIKGLIDLYHGNKEFNKDAILSVIKKLSEQGVIEKNKAIAKSVLNSLDRCVIGSNAPEFILHNLEHKEVKLSDFKGKYVYIIFWATWSNISMDELNSLAKISKKYEKEVAFIGVSCDKEVQTFWDYMRAHNYPWIMLHFENNYNFLENYRTSSLPVYVLIDGNGKILNYIASPPSAGLEEQLDRYVFEKEQKIKKEKEAKKKKPLPKM